MRRFSYFSPTFSSVALKNSAMHNFSSTTTTTKQNKKILQRQQHPALHLQETALFELHKELERDVEESRISNYQNNSISSGKRNKMQQLTNNNNKSIIGNFNNQAPLPPTGWSVKHSPGSCVFEMNRIVSFVNNKNNNNKNRRRKDDNNNSNNKSFWSTKISLLGRFETVDPSFWDSSVNLCEYVPFRVIIERIANNNNSQNNSQFSTTSSSSFPESLIHSQMLVVDCASVQSQLRLEKIFFAPVSAKEQLEQETNIGLFPSSSSSFSSGPGDIAALSTELKQSISEFLSSCGGIDNRLAEFVCQMSYFYEHEEYELWCGKLANFAGKSFYYFPNQKNKESRENDFFDDNEQEQEEEEEYGKSDGIVAKEIARKRYSAGNNRNQNQNNKNKNDDEEDYFEEDISYETEVGKRMNSILGQVDNNNNASTSSSTTTKKKNDSSSSSSSTSSVTGRARNDRFSRR